MTTENFVAVSFVRQARRLLWGVGFARLPRRVVEHWMESLNDWDPGWNVRASVRRFCRSRRREYLVEACVREDFALFQKALGVSRALSAWRKTQVDRLRNTRRILRISARRVKASRAPREPRDCLFIVRRLPLGGLERALVSLANAVASLGRTVDLLNLGEIHPALREDLDPGVRLVDVREALAGSYAAAVNYSNWHFPEILTRGVSAHRKVQWVHNDLLWTFGRFPRDAWAREYRRLDHIVCVSESSRRTFSLLYPSTAQKTETIYCVYDLQRVRGRSNEAPAFVLPRDRPVVVTVARLGGQKGLERAVKAHAMLASEGLDFRWYVIGEGALRPRIEAAVREVGLRDRFVLLGEISNPFPLMRQADVFALPSYSEGFPLVTLEAKALGLPVLLADFSSARESVVDEVDGLVVPNNTRGIAEGLERMLRDSVLRQRLRKNLQEFRWDNATLLRKVQHALFALPFDLDASSAECARGQRTDGVA